MSELLVFIIESCIIAAFAALLYAPCALTPLGALQQAGYNGRQLGAWARRKGNMIRSRYTLLAMLIALASLVLGLCFTFAGRWAAYIALLPLPLFALLYGFADRRALKVPLVGTKRANRIYALLIIWLFIVGLVLVFLGNVVAFYAQNRFVTDLRFLLLAAVPLLFVPLLRLANVCEKPFSSRKNKKYLAAAAEKLRAAPCKKIGITGSCGKTSVKNFLGTILSEKYRVLVTPESYNTPLGIAKAIEHEDLSQYDYFIAEMGARHAGDIAELCALVHPDHCILTGICPQHVETFGSVEGVIAAKSEIFAGTNEGGFAVIGLDEYTEKLEPSAQNLVRVTVGEHGECCVQDVVCTCEGIRFTLALGILQVELQSKLLGAHNALNIALAAALAFKLGMSKEEIAAGVANIDYVPHRLQPVRKKGVVILDDAYNANVRGAQAAVEVLRLFPGRKIIVTPGLVELGILQQRENEALGGRLAGLDMVILVGETLVGAVKSGYLDAGGEAEKLTVVPTLQAAQDLLEKELREGDTVLFLNDLPDIYG